MHRANRRTLRFAKVAAFAAVAPLASVVVAFALGGAACSTSDDVASPSSLDATADAPPSALGDAGVDSAIGPDAATCAIPLAAYCADGGECPTYDQLLHPSGMECLANWVAVAPACGGMVEFMRVAVDTSEDYYFDDTTHALVAITDHVAVSAFDYCVAGPPDFLATRPVCHTGGIVDDSPGCECPIRPGSNGTPGIAAPVGPMRAPQASCTDEQIDAFYGCIPQRLVDSGATCARFENGGTAADLACSDCLRPDDAGAGPLRTWGRWPEVAPNVSGCIALATNDVTGAGCASAYQGALNCRQDDCVYMCNVSTPHALDLCETTAQVEAGCVDPPACALPDGGMIDVARACGAGASTHDQYRAVARRFCGITPDAGLPDASGD